MTMTVVYRLGGGPTPIGTLDYRHPFSTKDEALDFARRRLKGKDLAYAWLEDDQGGEDINLIGLF